MKRHGSIKEILSAKERAVFRSLSTESKIQDFLNTLTMRTDSNDPIIRSPRFVLETNSASCMEGALFAVAVLRSTNKKAWLLDLKVADTNTKDVDHVVAVFEKFGHYGAISKTSHGVLRYREPVYATVRELALSYFHEYFLDTGIKTLRTYSDLYDVCAVFGDSWVTDPGDLFEIACALNESPHFPFLGKEAVRNLRRADPIEIAVGKIKE